MKEKKRLLNDQIRASKIQVVTDDGENLWEMSLDEAKQKASSLDLDLMEIWKKWNISIVKMIDYGKFLYRQKKQASKQKQQSKAPELKTLRITFKIWDHDLEIRKRQAEKFAAWGHPLKVNLMLRWRENHYADLANEKINSFVTSLEESYKLDGQIRKNWNTFVAILKSKK